MRAPRRVESSAQSDTRTWEKGQLDRDETIGTLHKKEALVTSSDALVTNSFLLLLVRHLLLVVFMCRAQTSPFLAKLPCELVERFSLNPPGHC